MQGVVAWGQSSCRVTFLEQYAVASLEAGEFLCLGMFGKR